MNDYFPTKYDSARDEVIAVLSSVSEGYGADETGDTESPVGFVSLVILNDRPEPCGHPGHGPDTHACDLDFSDTTGAYPRGDYAGELARTYGVTADDVRGSHIVTHDSQGFVSVETFDTEQEARDEYDCRAARYAAWSDDDREDGDDIYICPVIGHGYHTL